MADVAEFEDSDSGIDVGASSGMMRLPAIFAILDKDENRARIATDPSRTLAPLPARPSAHAPLRLSLSLYRRRPAHTPPPLAAQA